MNSIIFNKCFRFYKKKKLLYDLEKKFLLLSIYIKKFFSERRYISNRANVHIMTIDYNIFLSGEKVKK